MLPWSSCYWLLVICARSLFSSVFDESRILMFSALGFGFFDNLEVVRTELGWIMKSRFSGWLEMS